MSLEFLNSIAPILTIVIVAATAIAALVQLKHMRAGNQISALLAIAEELSTEKYADAADLVRHRLAAAMEDPVYREYEVALTQNRPAPAVDQTYVEIRRASVFVGNAHEQLGILVKSGIVDRDMLLDRYNWLILLQWRRLEAVTALSRAAMGNTTAWENFEYLAVLSEDYMAKHQRGTYPRGVRRMPLTNRWPLPEAATPSR